VGSVKDFINKVKLKEGFRFDREVAELVGVDKHTLANAKLRNKLPEAYVIWYCKKYNITIEEFDNEISIIKDNKKKDNKMYEFALELAQDKILIQQEEINKLKSIIDKKLNQNQPLWNDIQFDVRTTQTYKKGRYDTFEKYEMVHYQDFYKHLGYNKSEAEKYWKMQHKFMTSDVNERGYNPNFIEPMGFVMKLDKTDKAIMDPKETQSHFEVAIKNNIVSQLQIYNACYIKKDGSEANAIVSVLFDFTIRSSKSKIKFLTS
jgi:hypothetical protein